MQAKTRQDVLKLVKEHKVKFVRLWLPMFWDSSKDLLYRLRNWKGHWMKEWALMAHPSRVLPVLRSRI